MEFQFNMYWSLDLNRYRKGFAHKIEDTLYFRSKDLASSWASAHNAKNSETTARDLREEHEEAMEILLENFFKVHQYVDRVSQKDLMKFCGL